MQIIVPKVEYAFFRAYSDTAFYPSTDRSSKVQIVQ